MKFYKYILSLLFTFAVLGCESYTDGINESPNAFVVASSDLLIGQVQLSFMQHMASNNARYTSVFTNQFSGGDRQYLTLNTYSPNRGNYNDMWFDTYIEGINNARIIIEDENAGDLVKGVAEILRGVLLADMALLYGDVPYTEASNANEFPNPKYDSQSSVLNGALTLIGSGIAKVGDASITAGFGGNRLAGGTWKEAANTLAARYSLAKGDYSAAISFANGGISTRANDLTSLHGTSQENRNLYYQFIIDERQDYLVATDSHLVHLLDGTTARALSTPGDNLRYANYFLDNGARTLINTNSGGRFSQTSAFPLASYYENQLILAEAKFQTNDEAGARTHLNNVRSELRVQFGSDTVGFPDSSASGNDLLKHILEEKFITLVGEIVTFHDLRRTRNFIAVPNKTTGSTGANDFPQRFLYPQSEVDTNENIPSPLPEFFSTTELLGGSY